MITIDNDFLSRLTVALTGSNDPEMLDAIFDMDKDDGHAIDNYENGTTWLRLFPGHEGALNANSLDEMVDVDRSFNSNGFTMLVNGLAKTSYHHQFTDNEGYDDPQHDWYFAFIDNRDPSTLFLVSSVTISNDSLFEVDSLNVQMFDIKSEDQLNGLLHAHAGSALIAACQSGEVAPINDMVMTLASFEKINLARLIIDNSNLLPDLFLKFIACTTIADTVPEPYFIANLDRMEWCNEGDGRGQIAMIGLDGYTCSLSFDNIMQGSTYSRPNKDDRAVTAGMKMTAVLNYILKTSSRTGQMSGVIKNPSIYSPIAKAQEKLKVGA